uniref:Uncharacterized protein n=1 Tax=Nelumbo nucifera TaxID=4432 RepID=A0A822ZH59_NELNU|nr:TPA_asm: hypothetical protein HUJ06_000985 [Nelumbo nucifera]
MTKCPCSCRIHDYKVEGGCCLLLRASWFTPLAVEVQEEVYDEFDDLYEYQYEYEYEDEEDDDLDEGYFISSSSIRIGNRRWGDNGYVRAGRKEARPVSRENFQDNGTGPSHGWF